MMHIPLICCILLFLFREKTGPDMDPEQLHKLLAIEHDRHSRKYQGHADKKVRYWFLATKQYSQNHGNRGIYKGVACHT